MRDQTDALTRRVADCLERHLDAFGFEPYRYPSGENKSIHLRGEGELLVADSDGAAWLLAVTRVEDR